MRPAMRLPLERGAALGILGLLLAIAWFAVGAPILDAFTSRREALDDAARLAAGFERVLAERPSLEARRKALQAAGDETENLVPGGSIAAAGAALQTLARQAIESRGGQVSSLTLGAANAAGDLKRLPLSVDATLPGDRLPDLLGALADSKPRLALLRLNLRAANTHLAPAAAKDGPPRLQLHVEVAGFVRGDLP